MYLFYMNMVFIYARMIKIFNHCDEICNQLCRAANQYAFGVFSTISRYQIRQYDFVGFVTLLLIF